MLLSQSRFCVKSVGAGFWRSVHSFMAAAGSTSAICLTLSGALPDRSDCKPSVCRFAATSSAVAFCWTSRACAAFKTLREEPPSAAAPIVIIWARWAGVMRCPAAMRSGPICPSVASSPC